MATVTNKEIPQVFAMWGDVFTFQKKFYNAPKANDSTEDKDKFWDEFIIESDAIVRKYDTKLCNAIVLAITDDINERSKSQ